MSARKLRLTKAALAPEKPTSIMPRMASGTASVTSGRRDERGQRRKRPSAVAGEIGQDDRLGPQPARLSAAQAHQSAGKSHYEASRSKVPSGAQVGGPPP